MLAENVRLAAGSTQGRNEQNEQSVDGDEVEEIHVEAKELNLLQRKPICLANLLI